MKNHLTSGILLLLSLHVFSQGSKVSLDKGFIDKTIEYYYATQAKQQKGASIFFIERDSMTMNAKTDYGVFKVQFLSAEEASRKLRSVRKTEAKLDRLVIKWISLDTIDVVITGCTIGQRKVSRTLNNQVITKTENFLTNCTQGFVDIPTCRFVYDPGTTKWSQVNKGKELR
jgi:hypothetical protein